jgi:hypothetical protein
MIDTKISKKATNAELELSVKAQTEYSNWRAIDDAPEDHGLSDLQCLQVNLIRWEVHNFGVQAKWTSALGSFEELGELLEAVEEADEEGVLDAIGDFMVFSVNLCTKLGLDFDAINTYALGRVGSFSGMDTLIAIWKGVGTLSHVLLKTEQQIRGYDDRSVCRRDGAIAMARIVSAVTELAFAQDIAAEAVLFGVATEVMKRDWVKYPETGFPEEPYGTESASFTSGGCAGGPSPSELAAAPTMAFSSIPETGRYQDGDGVVRYVVDGNEVSEQAFEAQRR